VLGCEALFVVCEKGASDPLEHLFTAGESVGIHDQPNMLVGEAETLEKLGVAQG
jgi:hypothetical protein